MGCSYANHMKNIEFRVRTCACISSCVLVKVNTHTLKSWCFSSYSSIPHLYCFKNVVSRTKIPIYFSRTPQCCSDVFLLGLCRGAEIKRRFLALSLRCAQCSSPDNQKRHENAQLIVAKFSRNRKSHNYCVPCKQANCGFYFLSHAWEYGFRKRDSANKKPQLGHSEMRHVKRL